MKRLHVFDLDGTLASIDHRLFLIKRDKPDWNTFFDLCGMDRPIDWVIRLMRICHQNGEVLILTGRSDAVKGKTEAWLKKHTDGWDWLVMRPHGDYSPDDELKKHQLEHFLSEHPEHVVQFIVDDRQRVVDMWRKMGWNVLQCEAWSE